MTKQYKKIADSSDTLMIKEAIESLSNVSITTDLGDSIAELVKELREARIQRESYCERAESVAPPPPLDVEGLVESIFKLTNKTEVKPTYTFKIERNHSGVLTGITATPNGGNE